MHRVGNSHTEERGRIEERQQNQKQADILEEAPSNKNAKYKTVDKSDRPR